MGIPFSWILEQPEVQAALPGECRYLHRSRSGSQKYAAGKRVFTRLTREYIDSKSDSKTDIPQRMTTDCKGQSAVSTRTGRAIANYSESQRRDSVESHHRHHLHVWKRLSRGLKRPGAFFFAEEHGVDSKTRYYPRSTSSSFSIVSCCMVGSTCE
jgi:hypothetical protein